MDDDANGFTNAAFRFCPGCHAHRFPNSPALAPARCESTFFTQTALSFAPQENGPDSDVEVNSGANLNSLFSIPARFRRLFATAQSTAASQLANPLAGRRFPV